MAESHRNISREHLVTARDHLQIGQRQLLTAQDNLAASRQILSTNRQQLDAEKQQVVLQMRGVQASEASLAAMRAGYTALAPTAWNAPSEVQQSNLAMLARVQQVAAMLQAGNQRQGGGRARSSQAPWGISSTLAWIRPCRRTAQSARRKRSRRCL